MTVTYTVKLAVKGAKLFVTLIATELVAMASASVGASLRMLELSERPGVGLFMIRMVNAPHSAAAAWTETEAVAAKPSCEVSSELGTTCRFRGVQSIILIVIWCAIAKWVTFVVPVTTTTMSV